MNGTIWVNKAIRQPQIPKKVTKSVGVLLVCYDGRCEPCRGSSFHQGRKVESMEENEGIIAEAWVKWQ